MVSVVIARPGYSQTAPRSGNGTHGKNALQAVRAELPVVLDGVPDEPAWRDAPLSLGFVQKDPQEGEPSTEKTEFRVLYTATTLYVGVICYDGDPAGILATDRRRDSELENDDTLTLVLDTFHDHRNAFLFRTNPLGTQYDALITDEGNNFNENWDEKWEVAAQISEAGWTAEFAIPFKSLRVPEENGKSWGVDLERVIRRKNEQSYWNNFRRGFQLENLSQAGHLQGIENIETGLRLRVKPYVLGGISQAVRRRPSGPEAFRSSWTDTSDVGMEVMKFRITPSLTADFTWNTDFAQTEVDDQQVNLDRFPLFFPEKREFFLEGAGIYEFGLARAEGTTDMKLFHTRRLGLSARGNQVPITAGARVTGNVAGLTLGLVNVQTDPLESESLPESNYSVLRVKRNVLSRSTIGGFFLNRELGGSDDYNRVFGLDSNFIFHRYLTLSALWAKSEEPGKPENNWVSSGTAEWESDFWIARGEYVFIEPNFRDDLGFVPRRNMRRLTSQIGVKPRPRSGPIRQISIFPRIDYITDREWNIETRTYHYTVRFDFHSGDTITISPHTRFERVAEPFSLRRRIDVPAGDYNFWNARFQYRGNPARRLSGSFVFEPQPGYFGGDLVTWTFQPRLRVNNNLAIDWRYQINRFTFPQGDFTDHVNDLRLTYNFNNRWLTATTLQYNNADRFSGINFRLNYIFRPGDDFFLVYNEGRRVGGPLDGERDRSIQAKLTYSFDF